MDQAISFVGAFVPGEQWDFNDFASRISKVEIVDAKRIITACDCLLENLMIEMGCKNDQDELSRYYAVSYNVMEIKSLCEARFG